MKIGSFFLPRSFVLAFFAEGAGVFSSVFEPEPVS